MRKNLLYFLISGAALFASGVPLLSVAQTGMIRGSVKEASGEALPGASIYIKGNTTGVSTDAGGSFSLPDLPEGRVDLHCEMLGYEAQDKTVVLKQGDTVEVNFALSPARNRLQQVEIIGRREKTYKNARSFIGSKTEMELKDLPQSVSYVTKEVIADQGLMRTGEVVRNFAGVNQFSVNDDITIRGFRLNGSSNTQLINGLRATTGFWKQPLVNYLERVEVLKGPSSALFGNATPGGVINRVTKKPLDVENRALSFSLGSYNNFRALGDFTGPVTENGTLLYRLNLGYENAQSFRDLQFDKNIVAAPSVSFLPSEQTRLNFDVIYRFSDSRLDRGQAVFGDGDLYSTPVSQSINSANDYLKEETYNVTASLNHRFSERFSLTASYMRTGYSEDLLEHRGANTRAKDGDGNDIPTLVEMQVFQRKRKRFMDNLTAFLNYELSSGPVVHKLLAGYDYAQQMEPPGGSQLQANGYRNADNTGSISTYDASKREDYKLDENGNPEPNVPHFDLENIYASQHMKDMSKYFYRNRDFPPSFYNLHAVYLQDQLEWGKLKMLLGLRYEKYKDILDYKTPDEENVYQDVWLPRLGLVYSVLDQINVYGTYVEGYSPQTASALANPNAGGPFDPLISNMIEGGIKSEWFRGRLSLTLAVYHIEEKNGLYNARDQLNPDLMIQVGKTESKGVELEATGQVLPSLSILASYAYNDAKITEAPQEETELGRQKPNAPHHQGNVWARYSVPFGRFAGLGAGFGMNFVSSRILSLNTDQTVPGYALLNAALYYQVNNVKVQLNLNNLTDKTHWIGGYDYLRLFPGTPRNYMVTLGYTF